MTKCIRLLTFLSLSLWFVPACFAQDPTGWRLVWSDEFSQADGSSPDPTKWTYDIGTGSGGWGNGQLEYSTARTNNVRIEEGQLIIEARRETYQGRAYTSARLKTQGKASWKYGRIEARIKIPRGQGIWPAFWMLGTSVTSAGWPDCGEIDIMENVGSIPSTVYGTVHGPSYSGGESVGGSLALPGGSAFADDYHVYAVEWTTNQIRWLVDGGQYFSATPASLPSDATWVFTQPQFLVLNVAVGGTWPGSPDATTTFPQRMTVDYVRVYAPVLLAANGVNVLVNPGFEAGGLAGWTPYGNAIGNAQLAHIRNLPVHTGSNAFKVFGQFSGAENYSGLIQDVPAVPGTTYSASARVFTPSDDRIAGANAAWVEVSFRDALSTIKSLFRTPVINSASPAGTWLHLAVTHQVNPANGTVIRTVSQLLAPAGTTKVRCQVVFRQPASSNGAVLFDELRLVRDEAVEFPVTVAATRSGGRLQLAFDTYLDRQYEVRSTVSLASSPWLVLTNLPGDGATRTLTVEMPFPASFYRVNRLEN